MSARVYNTLNANGRDRQDVVTTTLLLVLFFVASVPREIVRIFV